MAILWAGSEDVDFPTFTGMTVTTTPAAVRSGYARAAVYNEGTVVGKSNVFAGGAVTDFWLSARMGWVGSHSSNRKMFGLGKSGTDGGLAIGTSSGGNTKLALFKTADGSSWTELAAESGGSLTTSTMKLDVHVASFGASATVTVYVDGVLVITYSGDVTSSGVTSLDSVYVWPVGFSMAFSEIIVANEDTSSFSLLTMAPSSAGDSNAWTSGAYTDIDETTINDADVLNTNTTGQDFLCNVTDLPAGSFSVKAVRIAARASATAGSTAASIQVGVKSGGTTSVGSSLTPGTSFTTVERLMTTNPVTSSAFLQSEMNALQLAIRSAT